MHQILSLLPEKTELWPIEGEIQISTSQQIEYRQINHLLKLREGVNSGLKIEEMAERIYGVSKEDIESKLKRLDLIDEYLKEFLHKTGKYYLVNKLNEHFIDLCTILELLEKPRGPQQKDWEPEDSDINELKLVGFYYIKANWPHMRIRDLKKLFYNKKSWNKLKAVLEINPDITDEDKQKVGVIGPEVRSDEDTEPEQSDNSYSTPIEKKDLQAVRVWIESHKDQLQNSFEDAAEFKQIEIDKDRPLKLAEKALINLQGIHLNAKIVEANGRELDKFMGEIITIVNDLRKFIHKKNK